MKKIIMDCDPGHDDAIALLLASRADDLQILGVTTVAGNTDLENTTGNARRILDYGGVTDVDVYPGCDRPLMRPFSREGEAVHGSNGLGGVDLPEAVTPVKKEHAVDFIIRTLRESKKKITLVPTGPLTNIAMALVKAPDIRKKIDRIVIMGGAVREPGNINSAAEFNIYMDPEAAKIVFSSGCEIFLNTLDVTMKAIFYEEDIEKLRAQSDKISVMVAELLDYFSEKHIEIFGCRACPIHDALCIGVLIDDSLVEYEKTYLDVSLSDPLTRGETVADLGNKTGNEPNCHIGVKVNRELFVGMIQDHMKKPYRQKK